MVRTTRRPLTALIPGSLLVASLFMVPTQAAAVADPDERAGLSAAASAAIELDPSSRESMRQGYLEILKPALDTPIGWTGDLATCDAGAPSAAAQEATLTAVNYFRELVGVQPVTFDPTLSAKAQQAALMMARNRQLSHQPPDDWPCRTPEGDAAAARSNLSMGRTGAAAIPLYMDDPGLDTVGHRRWVIDPATTVTGSGSVDAPGTDWQQVTNALYIADMSPDQAAVAPGTPTFLPWPSAGYVPIQLEPEGRWSLSSSNYLTSFSSATVKVDGVSVTPRPIQNGFGPPTLVWTFSPGFSGSDKTIDVEVSGIHVAGTVTSHSYSVTLFDAEAPPPKTSQTITFGELSDRTYGAAAGTLDATASSQLPVTFTTTTPGVCTTSGDRGRTLAVVGAGICTVAANQEGNDSYTAAPEVQRSFTVSKKQLTVDAQDASRRTGEPNPELEVAWSGFAHDETLATSGVTGAPSCSTTATTDSPPGSYPISCVAGSLASSNYSFSFEPGTLTVQAADITPPTVSAAGKLFRVVLYEFGTSWKVSEDADGLQQRQRTRMPSTSWGPWSIPEGWHDALPEEWAARPPGETLCLSARGRDAALNVSDWSGATCVHTPVDDTDLVASAPWKTVRSTGLWFGSALTTAKQGARLTLDAVDTDRVGIVATRCRDCGTVAVFVGRVKVGVLRLASDQRETQDVMLLPRLAQPLDGPVKVVVRSAGKKVQVDGVVASGLP